MTDISSRAGAGRAARFRFAVIADTHVNPSEQDLISPFESHRLTNERLRHTVRVLNSLQPDLVVHVGDMVHPVPEAVTYPQAVARFREAMSGLKAPLKVVPGNHDIGDKQADFVPAGSIQPGYIDLYREHFGDDFHAFDAGGCRFVVINTSLINSGLPQEQQQATWLERELSAHAGRRLFLCIHYPPFIAEASEPGHYDNIDEPGRGWLMEVIRNHRVTAVFTGHVHNFFFNRIGETPVFSMPSTAFVRGDYSELFAVGQPASHENGRNDTSKLAVLVIDVHEDRIVPQFIRTLDGGDAGAQRAQRDWPLLPPAAGSPAALGIDLRYSWSELHEIPYSSMLDEFRRKLARNDYPILALWEMGIGKLRVPIDDLCREQPCDRMLAMAAQGSRFTVFCFGWPDALTMAHIARHRAMLHAVEVVVKWPLPPDLSQRLGVLASEAGVPVHLSRFWSASGHSRDGKQIKLLVDHGFAGASDETAGELVQAVGPGAVQGLVFRIPRSVSPRQGILDAVQRTAPWGVRAQVHVRLADDSPAVGHPDVHETELRVLEAAFCAQALPQADVFIDTLSDVDRGYFPRAGLVDRRFNPRSAGHALRNLHGVLSGMGPLTSLEWSMADDVLVGRVDAGVRHLALVLGASGKPADPAAALAVPGLVLRRIVVLATGDEIDPGSSLPAGPVLLEFSAA